MELERARPHGLHAAQPEVQEDRLLQPFVDGPVVVDLLGHARLALVEQGDGLLHRAGVLLVLEQGRVGKGRLDCLLKLFHPDRSRARQALAARRRAVL